MAAVPSASVREEAGVAAFDLKVSRVATAAALLVLVAFVAIGSEHTVARDLVIFPLSDLAAATAIAYGVRRFRPRAPEAWLLIAAALAVYFVGDLIWGIFRVQDQAPFPSAADVFYLSNYPLLAAGLAIAVYVRRELVDRRAAIDAGLVVTAAFLLSWVYIMRPMLENDSLSKLERAVTVAYPIGDLLLLGLAVRFAFGASWGARSLRLLVEGLALLLLGDLMFNIAVANGHVTGSLSDALLLAGILGVGLAGLHPSMTALTDQRGEPPEGDGRSRLLLVLGISLVPAAVIVVQDVRDKPLYLASLVAVLVLDSILVMFRFTTMTNRALRAARRESLLSTHAEELMVAGTPEELNAIAERTAERLVGRGSAALVEPAAAGGHAFAAPVVVRGEQLSALVADTSAVELRRVRHSLETVATELALALEREQLLATERETAAALAEQNERLRELDRMKDQFVSTVSHELRTPLTSMVGYLDIMRKGHVGELTDGQQRTLEIVDRNSHRLNSLIEDILASARIESGRLTLSREKVSLAELVAERVDSIRGTAQQKPVELQFEPAEVPQLQADPMRLGQVIDNLLSNAVKFTPAGGRVNMRLEPADDTVRLSVADTGVGIPAEDLERLFGRFFRASTASTIQGTGLGLSIAKAIVELHGGQITVASEVGVGTTFTVALPLEGAPAAAQDGQEER
jgi:signal transduction histidine kinase